MGKTLCPAKMGSTGRSPVEPRTSGGNIRFARAVSYLLHDREYICTELN